MTAENLSNMFYAGPYPQFIPNLRERFKGWLGSGCSFNWQVGQFNSVGCQYGNKDMILSFLGQNDMSGLFGTFCPQFDIRLAIRDNFDATPYRQNQPPYDHNYMHPNPKGLYTVSKYYLIPKLIIVLFCKIFQNHGTTGHIFCTRGLKKGQILCLRLDHMTYLQVQVVGKKDKFCA